MKTVGNIIYPDFPKRKGKISPPVENLAARVVFDFEHIFAATKRRKRYHRFMNRVDSYADEKRMSIKTREDIYRLLLTRITQELKEHRYHLDMDVITAVSRIVTIVVEHLRETEPGEFSTPNLSEALNKSANPGEAAIIQYIFSSDRASSPELDQLKDVMREYYLEKADATWRQYGRAEEDGEMMYEHMGHILPIIVSMIKLYMIPYRSMPDYGIDHSANSK